MKKTLIYGLTLMALSISSSAVLAKDNPVPKNQTPAKNTTQVVEHHTLQQVIAETMRTNPNIMRHLKTFLAAQHATRAAKGGYLPRLDIRGEIGTEMTNDISSTPPFTDENYTPRGATAVLSQMLFDGFATSSEVKRNKYLTEAERYQLLGAKNDVALLATKAYLDILRTCQIMHMARDNYSAHSRTYEMIRKRSESGVGRKVDTTQAYGRLSLAKASLIAAKNNYYDAQATFERITGVRAGDLVLPKGLAEGVLPKEEIVAEQRALSTHPLLKAADADIKEAKAQNAASKAPHYPRFDLVAKAGHGFDVNQLEERQNSYGAFLQMHYNLYKGGSDLARNRQTAELVGKAKAIRENTYRQVVENMRLAWHDYESFTDQLTYLGRHRDSSKTTLNAYKKQFKIGKRTLLDLLDSEDEVFSSRVNYINGRIKVLLAQYRILNGEGMLLNYFQNNAS